MAKIVQNLFLQDKTQDEIRQALSEPLIITGTLNLQKTDIGGVLREVADNLKIRGCLDLSGSSVNYIPRNLKVGGWLDLSDTAMRVMPSGIEVADSLDFTDSALEEMPHNLVVGDVLNLTGTPLETDPDLFLGNKPAWDSGDYVYIPEVGSENGTLRLGRDGTVHRGCFDGTIDAFEAAVARKHGSNVNGREYQAIIMDWKAELKRQSNGK